MTADNMDALLKDILARLAVAETDIERLQDRLRIAESLLRDCAICQPDQR